MSWRWTLSTLGAAFLMATRAGATPRESVVFHNVISNGVLNDPTNSVLTHPFAGGYTLGRIDLSGTLTSLQSRTWSSDSRILITAPDGVTSVVFQPFATGGPFSVLNFNRSLYLPPGRNPAGTWTFRFYEFFDDGGPSMPDASWDITITLTDEAPVPPASTELGTIISPGRTIMGDPLAPGGVRWYHITLPSGISSASQSFLDIDTYGSTLSGGATPNDTILAVYDSTGTLVAWDDDSGDGFTSAMSFGAGTRPGRGNGRPFDGRNGPLAAGTYYVAIASSPAAVGPLRWEVAPGGVAGGTVSLTLATNIEAPCYANCDNSTTPPVLNVNDFICFQNRFAAGDAYANCDGSTVPPVLNVNDFICFQNRFASGCP